MMSSSYSPLVFLVLLAFPYTDAKMCGMDEFMAISECDKQWGFSNLAASNGPGQVLNIQKLIEYCSHSERSNIEQCSLGAFGDCEPLWGQEKNDQMMEQFSMVEQGLGYICSNVDVLQSDWLCLNNTAQDITDCYHSAQRTYMEEVTGSQSQDPDSAESAFDEPMERFGRNIEACLMNVIGSSCEVDSAKLFANFAYGTYVYVFDQENSEKR